MITLDAAPKVVLFDLDGTLYDFYGPAQKALTAALRLGIARLGSTGGLHSDSTQQPDQGGLERLLASFWSDQYPGASARLGTGLHPRQVLEEAFMITLRLTPGFSGSAAGIPGSSAAGIPGSPGVGAEMADLWLQEFFAGIHPFGEVRRLLQDLCCRGIQTGIISNGFGPFQREKLQVLGLGRFFPEDALFFSSEIGLCKPDPSIFKAALDRLGASPREAFFVGDSPATDLPGAIEAGLTVIWLNRFDLTLPTALPVDRVKVAVSFTEVAAILRTWSHGVPIT